ncbi:MAG: hypothetical protein AMXMBFR64_60890 [Myxococcales bacterium]
MRKADKERVLVEVTSRAVASKIAAARDGSGLPLENLLNDTLYHERKRLETEPRNAARKHDLAFWNEIGRALGRASQEEVRDLLKRVVERYVIEIMGNFSDSVYRVATKALPIGLGGLLNALSPARLVTGFPSFPSLDDTLIIQGDVDTLRSLDEKGTIVMAPTHLSNLDSIIMGWAIYRMGLPPYLYGAGLNLFSNPLISFFMNNLGAYRVDRKKKSALYKDVLKEYATCSIELGYDNLFFPGGTRSRSGLVEQKLKLGLLGTGLGAYINNLRTGRPSPKVFVVPVTLSYHLVLEAETLIDDYLKEAGKARYIITDDEFSRPRRIATFLSNLVNLDARIYITVCPPLDPFGNRVLADGTSVDARGRAIDIERYVHVGGRPDHDPWRDQEYTLELGDSVRASFLANNVAMSTHLLAFAMFRLMRDRNPGLDLYRLLRTGGDEDSMVLTDVYARVDALLGRVGNLVRDRRIQVDPRLDGKPVSEVVSDALRHFGTYHSHAVVERRGDRLFAGDMNLLYYYHNRLVGYGLEAKEAA